MIEKRLITNFLPEDMNCPIHSGCGYALCASDFFYVNIYEPKLI